MLRVSLIIDLLDQWVLWFLQVLMLSKTKLRREPCLIDKVLTVQDSLELSYNTPRVKSNCNTLQGAICNTMASVCKFLELQGLLDLLLEKGIMVMATKTSTRRIVRVFRKLPKDLGKFICLLGPNYKVSCEEIQVKRRFWLVRIWPLPIWWRGTKPKAPSIVLLTLIA